MEEILLVDYEDNPVGYGEKIKTHVDGTLHRAFSIFIIHDGKMLIQKRNSDKYHSGGLWTNACCSHQRKGEELEEAVHRRLVEELGFDCELTEQFKFTYRTVFHDDLVEYEIDHVFLGDYDGEFTLNPDEAEDARWISLPDLKKELAEHPETFTSWFIIAFSMM